MSEKLPRRGTNWEQQFTSEERGKLQGKEVVYLRGLQRLAEEAGIVRSSCIVLTPSSSIIQAIYSVEFDDGTLWVGTGDCSSNNTEKPYINYPTAVAESRAEARCLKKALGIRILAAEEIGFESLEAAPNNSIDSSIVKAIESLCSDLHIDPVEVVEEVVVDKNRAMNISELNHLTASEGQAAMAWLNEQSVRKTKPTAASTRADRKKELESQLGDKS